METSKKKRMLLELVWIFVGSALYAVSTVLFVFPHGLLLGGTSGISVILTSALPFSPGVILMIINFTLIIAAFAVLGRGMAFKTLIGSILTTVFIGAAEKLIPMANAPISNLYISALTGAAVIALASGVMFYVDSSSGGTDIVALIVRKYSGIRIGRALLITDILIVLVGGLMSAYTILFSSVIGLLVKTLGIDLVILTVKRLTASKEVSE